MERLDGTTIIRSYVVRIFAELFLQPGFENEDVNMTMNASTHMRMDMIRIGAECDEMSSQTPYLAAIILGVIRLLSSLILSNLLVLYRRRTMYLASTVGSILRYTKKNTNLINTQSPAWLASPPSC